MNKLKAILGKRNLQADGESSASIATRSNVSREYKNITAADNTRLLMGDVHGVIHFGDIHNQPSPISR
jgi:hypothetical protein